MVEDDGVEVPAVVVLDEVLSGAGRLQAPSPRTRSRAAAESGSGPQHLSRGRTGVRLHSRPLAEVPDPEGRALHPLGLGHRPETECVRMRGA